MSLSFRSCVAAVVLVLPITACRDGPAVIAPELQPASALAQGANAVSVMTQNLYHGADINAVTDVPSNQVPFALAAAWATIQATDFPTRARALADEIAVARPHLIGLQEVTTWRTQTPSDFVQGHFAPNAITVEYDFLSILLDALAARGLDYHVAALTPTSDIEAPAYTGIGPVPFMDLRYGDADAVLVRSDVTVLQTFTQQYVARVEIDLGGLTLVRLHGFAAARVRIGQRQLTFVSTHLVGEQTSDIQIQQTAELIAWANMQAAPVLVVGDFNSAANPDAPAGAATPTYGIVTQVGGYADAHLLSGGSATGGKTCCHAGDLSNAAPSLTQRIDFIFLRGFAPPQSLAATMKFEVLGDEAGDRFSATDALGQPVTLWPSDHAGVVASFVPAANPLP